MAHRTVLVVGPGSMGAGMAASLLRAGEHLTLALKSSNFGAGDFFQKAAARLEGDA